MRLTIYNNKAYSLLDLLISTSISLIIFAATLHYLHITIKSYNNFQRKLDYQNAQLIAYYYLAIDIRNACFSSISPPIQPDFDILTLNSTRQNISYYVKASLTPTQDHMHSYALYRDDFTHNATALIEGLTKFRVKIDRFSSGQNKVQINIEFKNNSQLEAIFVTRNPKQA